MPFFVPSSVLDDLRAELRELRAERRRLTRIIVKMKVAGGSIPLVRQGVQLPPKPADPLMKIIDENPHAKRNSAVRKALVDYLERERAAGINEQKIAGVLSTWSKVAGHNDDSDDTIALVTSE